METPKGRSSLSWWRLNSAISGQHFALLLIKWVSITLSLLLLLHRGAVLNCLLWSLLWISNQTDSKMSHKIIKCGWLIVNTTQTVGNCWQKTCEVSKCWFFWFLTLGVATFLSWHKGKTILMILINTWCEKNTHFFLAWFSCQRPQNSPHLHPQNTNTCNKLCIPMSGWAPPFLPSTQINPSAGVSSNHSHISFLRKHKLPLPLNALLFLTYCFFSCFYGTMDFL